VVAPAARAVRAQPAVPAGCDVNRGRLTRSPRREAVAASARAWSSAETSRQATLMTQCRFFFFFVFFFVQG
jgi:hypothetical protein